jgi:hypothetical protein
MTNAVRLWRGQKTEIEKAGKSRQAGIFGPAAV